MYSFDPYIYVFPAKTGRLGKIIRKAGMSIHRFLDSHKAYFAMYYPMRTIFTRARRYRCQLPVCYVDIAPYSLYDEIFKPDVVDVIFIFTSLYSYHALERFLAASRMEDEKKLTASVLRAGISCYASLCMFRLAAYRLKRGRARSEFYDLGLPGAGDYRVDDPSASTIHAITNNV